MITLSNNKDTSESKLQENSNSKDDQFRDLCSFSSWICYNSYDIVSNTADVGNQS